MFKKGALLGILGVGFAVGCCVTGVPGPCWNQGVTPPGSGGYYWRARGWYSPRGYWRWGPGWRWAPLPPPSSTGTYPPAGYYWGARPQTQQSNTDK
ncbi:MAG: hypothetical protein ABGW77_00315 [Campylobacterales bacterium]